MPDPNVQGGFTVPSELAEAIMARTVDGLNLRVYWCTIDHECDGRPPTTHRHIVKAGGETEAALLRIRGLEA